MKAVILAGGEGTRLRPLTSNQPKPMLPIGGRPLMELLIDQLRRAGIRRVNVTTHYKPEKIIEHFVYGLATIKGHKLIQKYNQQRQKKPSYEERK